MNKYPRSSKQGGGINTWSREDLERRLEQLQDALAGYETGARNRSDQARMEAQRIELEMQNRELRELQAQLQASRDLYADLYDFAPQTYLAVDREGLIHAINLTGARMLRWERDALPGKPLSSFIHPDDLQGFFSFLSELFGKEEQTSRELRLAPVDGWSRSVVVEGLPGTLPEDGTPVARLAVMDITERKRAERIRERENRVLRALQAVQQSVRKEDGLPGFLQEVCGHLAEMAGYALAWIAQPLDDEEKSIQVLGLAGETGYTEAIQARVRPTWGRYPDGSESALGRLVRDRMPLVANSQEREGLWYGREIARSMGMNAAAGFPLVYDDRVLGVLGLYAWEEDAFDEGEVGWLHRLADEIATAWASLEYRDRHRQAEHDRQHLLDFLDATPDFVAMADVHGNVLYRNPGAYRLLGQDPETLPLEAIRMSDMHPQWSWHRLRNEAFPTARAEGFWSGEMAFVGATGREISVHQVIVAHYGPDGEVERFSTIAHDLTAFKRQRAELERTRRVVALDELGSVVAHQLNQPLAAALGYADGTLHRWEGRQGLPEGSREGMERVKEQVQKAVDIVHDLRTF
ncbi:MAG TPA: PAS domain S-box protein, partial [Gammaproteobacteria bacterium]|nr:PAS domain S-box protein [Gammaproteobacteria bacterium]